MDAKKGGIAAVAGNPIAVEEAGGLRVASRFPKCKYRTGVCKMIETHSQSRHATDIWTAGPSRAIGLYGEMQPLPLPVAAPPASTRTHKPAAKSGLTG